MATNAPALIFRRNELYRNKAKCQSCQTIIESLHRYDFVACSCFTNSEDNTGIFLDGGSHYWRMGGNMDNFERVHEKFGIVEVATRKKKRPLSRGFVYIVKVDRYYKIGKSTNPDMRVKSIQTDNPYEIEVIMLLQTKDMRTLEKGLHKKYEKKRIRGEWFRLDENDLEDIRRMNDES